MFSESVGLFPVIDDTFSFVSSGRDSSSFNRPDPDQQILFDDSDPICLFELANNLRYHSKRTAEASNTLAILFVVAWFVFRP